MFCQSRYPFSRKKLLYRDEIFLKFAKLCHFNELVFWGVFCRDRKRVDGKIPLFAVSSHWHLDMI